MKGKLLVCTLVIFLMLPICATAGAKASGFTMPVHVQAAVKFSHFDAHDSGPMGWGKSPGESFVLTTTIEDKQYVLRGQLRVDLGDYKGRIVGKQQDHMELLLPNGKVRKYKIVRVGPIPENASKPQPQSTPSDSGVAPANQTTSLAQQGQSEVPLKSPPQSIASNSESGAVLSSAKAQPERVEVLNKCINWVPGADQWRVNIQNNCGRSINLWWGPYDKPSDSGKMNKLKKNVEAGKAASELRSQGDFYAVACPIGYKLKSISNTNPAVVIWTHLSSLECVLSSGY